MSASIRSMVLGSSSAFAAVWAFVSGTLAAQIPAGPGCANSVRDQAQPSSCIMASSAPTDGMLLPLGPYWFVDPAGQVGIGTKLPQWTLDVDVSGSGGMRLFDGGTDLLRVDAGAAALNFGLPQWNLAVPTVVTLADAAPALNFKAQSGWSVLSIDALNRRVGISGGTADVSNPLYPLHVQHNVSDDSPVLVARILTDVLAPNDNSNYYLGTSSTARAPYGSTNYSGGFIGLQADGSVWTSSDVGEATGVFAIGAAGSSAHVTNAWGSYSAIYSNDQADIDSATAVHAGVYNLGTGTIDEATGVFVDTPTAAGPIKVAYGVYIDSQATASSSYALYAVDGRSYFGGYVGLGVQKPTNILTVQKNSATDPIADAWTVYSSRRWKENIQTLPDALQKVRDLRGVTFDWKETGKHDVGFIAEEVGKVIPEVVQYEDDGENARSVDYARITAVLVEAVKTQQQQIEQMQQQIRALQDQLASPSR